MVETKVGDMKIKIEPVYIDDNNIGSLEPTGLVEEMMEDAYSEAKEIINKIAVDIDTQVNNVLQSSKINECVLEFSLGLEGSTNIWVLTSKGAATFKVQLKWISPE